ncbi:13599_t:CDS:2 [Ambispora gerdemannii]|uniref:13599_t:CDS:1 n=1 Tax=Ambispora gerdemannii TaxID=144530 RepID=A0A9N9AVY1_9GLOM|nr:13599_t:CDS:2 [Ambispora gerdemannii]
MFKDDGTIGAGELGNRTLGAKSVEEYGRTHSARLTATTFDQNLDTQTIGDGVDEMKFRATDSDKIALILLVDDNADIRVIALRSNPTTQFIPVILLSARASEEKSSEGLEKRADDYLTKPFNARELFARVRVNIQLSKLRHELVLQQPSQNNSYSRSAVKFDLDLIFKKFFRPPSRKFIAFFPVIRYWCFIVTR